MQIRRGITLFAIVAILTPIWLTAQDAKKPDPKDAELARDQDALVVKYDRFEKKLLELSDYLRKTEPERADLLRRALMKSKEERVSAQMVKLVEILTEEQLGEAGDRQDELAGSIQKVLDLLMSEDLDKKRKEEERRLKEYLKELNEIISREKDERAANERGEPGDRLVPRQESVTKKTEGLQNKIESDDQKKRAEANAGKNTEGKPNEGKPNEGKPNEGDPNEGKPTEGKPNEGKPNEGKPNEGKPNEGKPNEGKPNEGKPNEGKPNEGKPNEGKPNEGKPNEGKPNEGEPMEGMPSEGMPMEGMPSEGKPMPGSPMPGSASDSDQPPPKNESTPGKEEIQKAIQQMQQAIENLKKKNRKGAAQNQDKAIEELEKAKQKLEEILRQLREEERLRFLANLEARFQKMLQMQLEVKRDTVSLHKVPIAERTSRHTNRALQLSRSEAEISLEATKALTLLREEGTAVAFPEAVEQMRDDMQLVVDRLQNADVAELTQSIEDDIIDALREMILALQKEIEKAKDKEKNPMDPQPMDPPDPALVELLQELKLLRSLQQRINSRTQRLGRLVDGEQAVEKDAVDQLKQLSKRQSRIQKATYDLATGRNK